MDHPESNVAYSDEDASVHCREHKNEVVNCKETVWLDQVSCFIQQDASSKISKHHYATHASMILGHGALPNEPENFEDKKQKNDSPLSTVVSKVHAFGKEAMNLFQFEPRCSSANQIVDANQVAFPDCLSHSYVQPDKICEETQTLPETWEPSDQSRFAKEGMVSGNKEKCLEFQEPRQAVLEKDGHVSQWQKFPLEKCEKPIDQECSVSDICDDDTFMSIKSGSYSRSSSPLTIDDHTDTESCLFEEALEDLSCNFLYTEKSNLEGLLCTSTDTGQQSGVVPLAMEARRLSKALSLEMNNRVEMTAKQHRNISCNTEISWLIDCRTDKETQTKAMHLQEMGVNTDTDFAGSFPQGAVNVESGLHKDIKNCTRNNCFSSTSHDALMERVVNAELQLLDVQRWMCWQLCWKNQQQCMEKQSLVNMHNPLAEHSQAVVGFNLLSALTEVEEKYLEMKTRIQTGVPLDTLVPLSMQLTKVKTPPDNLLNQCFTEPCQLGIQKCSADHLEDLQKNRLLGNNLASTSLPSKTEDVQRERKEDHQPEQFSPEQKRYYVHVGNIAPSVKEVDLKTAFAKFEVSNTFLEESSLTSSYAVLIFTCSEKAQTAVKEMDGKIFFGKKLKVRVVKNSIQNFQFASQEIKIFSATLPEENTKLFNGEIQSSNFQPQQDVSTSSKPIPHSDIKKRSYGDNVNVSLNMPYNRAPFPGTSQTFLSAPTYSTSTIFGSMPPQWAWHSYYLNGVPYNSIPGPVYAKNYYPSYAFPGASPFSFQSPVNTPMCKPSVNVNSNSQFLFEKDVGFGVPPSPTGRYSVHNNKMPSSCSTRMCNKATSAVTTQAKDTAAQPVKKPASKSSENKHASSEFVGTTATSLVSSTLPITATAACKMPAVFDSLFLNDNKKIDTSEKTSLKPAAPLRFPMFVPANVTIHETDKTCDSTIATNTKDLLTRPSITDRSGSLPLDDVEQDVYPKLDPTSNLRVFIVPNRLNLNQFTKVMDYLLESHKNVTRDDVVYTLEEIRIGRGGSLGGLTIPQILKQASSKLAAKNMPSV